MNDDTNEAKPATLDKSSKIFALIIYHFGAVIRLVVIGYGCAALSHILTGASDGPRYFIGAITVGAVYLLGAIMEYAGEYSLKKDKKP